MEALYSLETPLVVMGCVLLSWKMMRHIWSVLDVEKEPITVLVTGAAGIYIYFFYFFILYTLVINFSYHKFKIKKK